MRKADTLLKMPIAHWLGLEQQSSKNLFKTCFSDSHIGNPMIRSLHGGVIGSVMEICAECIVREAYAHDYLVTIVSASVDYLRATHDCDLFCEINIVRQARRVAFVDALCWQDDRDKPVARGHLVLRIRQVS